MDARTFILIKAKKSPAKAQWRGERAWAGLIMCPTEGSVELGNDFSLSLILMSTNIMNILLYENHLKI